ncbi:hypothetical protein SOV_22550 [Sporomusa ovata DSM 2662]|uniref:Uncharacterized protein n=1 Tax=Sporomusa ovata TaxID=2378 RepID=A0A0U1L486_9FIRM|nr:hypothetical protein [Sporomusa ovata]EQB25571.1 hypothetical protein SOV_4c02340 [Sporomusa ovata DSM 2662]CQR74129.1 hypothetical protein SpAn4DRAFT_0591 [Sporomusa ovata]
MGRYTKTLYKLTKANQMTALYGEFILKARSSCERDYYFRLQANWLRKAEALEARLRGLSRKGRRRDA